MKNINHFWSFKDFQFTVELLYKEGLTWKIYFRYLWTCKQQINNSLKSDTFLIPPIFILHTFQDSCLSGSKFFWGHVFQDSGFLGPGFSRSRFSRVQVYQGRVQVLEVTLCNYMEITLRHRHSPVNLLDILERLFIRTSLEDCICMFKLWFLYFCIISLILRTMWAFIFFH